MPDRDRAQVRAEVKQAALRQLAESGPASLSVSAIAKDLGVSQPGLYRYFASRGELLTELVIDAYHDLSDAPRAAISDEPSQEPHARVRSPGARLPVLGPGAAAPVLAAVRAPAAPP